MCVKGSKAGAFVLLHFVKPQFGYVHFGCVKFTISFPSLDLFILDVSKNKLRIISVLWLVLPSGCNLYSRSGPSISGSDPYEYQPTSLGRAARPNWQSRAELFYLQRNFPGLLFSNQWPSQLPSAYWGELELGTGSIPNLPCPVRPGSAGEDRLRLLAQRPLCVGWGRRLSLFFFLKTGMVFPKQHQYEVSLACN